MKAFGAWVGEPGQQDRADERDRAPRPARSEARVAETFRELAIRQADVTRSALGSRAAALRFAEQARLRARDVFLRKCNTCANLWRPPDSEIIAATKTTPAMTLANRADLAERIAAVGRLGGRNEAELAALMLESGLFDPETYPGEALDAYDCPDAFPANGTDPESALGVALRRAIHALRHARPEEAMGAAFDPLHYRQSAEACGAPLRFLLAKPLAHYLLLGAARGLSPHPLFDPAFYDAQLPACLRGRIDPLSHYRLLGWRLRLDPHWAFSAGYYLARYADVAAGGVDPWEHYVRFGENEGRDPHFLISTAYYRQVARLGVGGQVLRHFIDVGVRERTSPSPVLDVGHFLASAELEAGENWFKAFLEDGLAAPHRLFDPRDYYMAYPDVLEAGFHAFAHYLNFGFRERRNPNLFFDAKFYASRTGLAADADPLQHYISMRREDRIPAHPLFDADFYVRTYADQAGARMSPYDHFCIHGASAGRSPNPWFDPRFYAQEVDRPLNSDLFRHYLEIGAALRVSPHPAFDAAAYAEANGLFPTDDPLAHLIANAAAQRARANPDGDRGAILAASGWRRLTGGRRRRPGAVNVLLVAHAVSNELFGGERSFLDMLRGIAGLNGVNVFAALPGDAPTYSEAVRPFVSDIFIGAYPHWRGGGDLAGDAVSRFRTLLASEMIDIVHVNTVMLREPLAAAAALEIRSLVHVRELVDHDPYLCEVIGADAAAVKAFVRENASVIVANSEATRAMFRPDDPVVVVPNTLDFEAFQRATRPPPNAGAAGRLSVGLISSNLPKKGVGDLFALAEAAQARLPQVEFVVIGPLTAFLSEQLEAYQARGYANVRYAGYAESPAEAVSHLDVVLNFSHFAESFGRTVLEAMAGGRPTIVYRFGALPELVRDGETGFIVRYRDPAAALEPLERLAADPALRARMGEAARETARERYGPDAYRAAMALAYRPLLEALGPPPPEALDRLRADPAARALSGRTADALEAAAVFPQRRLAPRSQRRVRNRIAYFQWHFPVPSETFVLNELRDLVRSGEDVIVFCRQSPHKDFKPDFDIHWEIVDSPETLARRLTETGRDVVHSHFTYPTVTDMVWPAARQAGVSFTFNAHAQDIFRYANDEKNRIGEVVSAPECLAVLVPGRFHREYLLARGAPGEKILIRPQAVDVSRYIDNPLPDPPSRARRTIGAIHRFTEKKGLHHLIRAAKRLERQGIGIVLWGYGDMEDAYRAAIAEEGVANVEIRSGVIDHDGIKRAFAEIDLFLCPSVRAADGDMDGIPTVVMEAMAFGLPVLTTGVSSLPELVQDGVTGFVCAPDDPDAIAEAVERFYAAPASALSLICARARASVLADYNVQRLNRVLRRVWSQEPIDIVIVSWNNLPELQEVIRRIYAYTSLPFHLTVCDNDSKADVVEFLEAEHLARDNFTLVKKGWNSMVGPGTNSAAAAGDGDIIVYVCGKEGFVTNFGWEESIIHYMSENPTIGLAGTLCYSPTYLYGREYIAHVPLWDKFRNKSFAEQNADRQFAHVQGGFFAMRRSMIEEIGGFSNKVPHNYTDVEFSYFVESCGWGLGTLPNILALFNKTRPDIRARYDESVRAVHPPSLPDGAWLDAIAHGDVKACNVCGWFGTAYADPPAQAICPGCGSAPFDRTVWRALAESRFMYRRLPALGINIAPALAPEWSKSFQGTQISERGLRELLAGGGRVNHGNGSLRLIVACDLKTGAAPVWRAMAEEWARLLSPNGGELWLAGAYALRGEPNPEGLLAREELSEILRALGLTGVDEIAYASRAIAFGQNKLMKFSASPR